MSGLLPTLSLREQENTWLNGRLILILVQFGSPSGFVASTPDDMHYDLTLCREKQPTLVTI